MVPTEREESQDEQRFPDPRSHQHPKLHGGKLEKDPAQYGHLSVCELMSVLFKTRLFSTSPPLPPKKKKYRAQVPMAQVPIGSTSCPMYWGPPQVPMYWVLSTSPLCSPPLDWLRYSTTLCALVVHIVSCQAGPQYTIQSWATIHNTELGRMEDVGGNGRSV